MKSSKLLVLGAVVLLVIVFFAFDLQQYATLEYLKSSQARFSALYAENTYAVLAAYFGIYVLVTALSLPGAAVITLAGGGLFGFWTALVVVSFASSVGATLAMLMARYLFRDWVQQRFGSKLEKVNTGIEQEGAFYLFSMRLIPIIPFFAINLLMGLSSMRAGTYYFVSQAGMLPGTMAYVFAGQELSRIDSLSGVIEPRLLAAFVILGLLPLVTKRILGWYKARATS